MSTTGKIFADSSNIYQDEAKVLFNYYQQAAERIVQEEERIEKQIEQVKAEIAELENKKKKLWVYIFLLIFPYFIMKNRVEKEIAEKQSRIEEFKKLHQEIFRDYKVDKLGVAYVPIADQIKYEDKSFIVDYTGQVSKSQVTLQLSRQNQLLGEAIGTLDQLGGEVPIVETSNEPETVSTDDYSLSMQEVNQNDYVGQLDRSLRTISYCMNDLNITSVELPLVQDGSTRLDNINAFATTVVPEGAPVLEVFDKARYQQDIEKFQDLNRLKNSLSTETQQFEDVLKRLMTSMASMVQSISAMKLSGSNKVINSSNRLLYRILKAPYNHYSPMLEAEEIMRIKEEKFDYTDSVQGYTPFALKQSSRVKYNLVTDEWVAEDGSRTNMPFGMHQIYEEIVAPIVQSLMQENRIERLKVYNHIKDQKISYLNKWHQDTDAFYRDNRKQSADLINLMQESLREYVAAYNTLISFKKTQDSMEEGGDTNLSASKVDNEQNTDEAVLAFETQAKQFEAVQADFEAFIDRIKDDIDERAEEFGHVEYYDARLQDGHSNELAVATGEVSQLEERRKELVAVNPLLAKKSEIPPMPQVEPITYDDLAINLNAIAADSLNSLDQQREEAAAAAVEEPQMEEEAPADEPALEEEFGEDVNPDDVEPAYPELQDEEAEEEEGDEEEDEEDEDDEEEGEDDEDLDDEEEEEDEENEDEEDEDEEDEDEEDEEDEEEREEDDDNNQ